MRGSPMKHRSFPTFARAVVLLPGADRADVAANGVDVVADVVTPHRLDGLRHLRFANPANGHIEGSERSIPGGTLEVGLKVVIIGAKLFEL